ncbi:aspartate aminotransferase family protein [Prochlorococcus sp. MIT 1307]|uniref:aspartate aminotransferase family protein n=1 Tax=Prochlorococcus sp. MIT 1307 TaxID=3096219 RepID=UPI002A756990|nr:aspartate aminotransferase family protein [Prochlorococcus sp. MIT 1307]
MDTYKRLPIKIVRGKGCWVWDQNGKRYLDAVAGIATCSLGHSDNALRRALTRQLNQIQHVSNLFEISEQEALASWLVDHSCADRAFFCNSGAEANEAAIKLARKYGHFKRGIEEPVILAAKAGFHGRTLAAISATGQPNYHKGFEPLVQGFEFFTYNDFASFEKLLKQIENKGPRVAAVLIEPIQGEGGINTGNEIFFQQLQAECIKREILLIFDEVQTGMGRSGNWWGYEHLGVEPDAFTIAKGLGGGHAIGALMVKQHANFFSPGDHASTFGGNPFACKAGITVATEIERRNLLTNVNKRAAELNDGLIAITKSFPNHLHTVRGLGLIQGLVLNEETTITAQLFTKAALNEKLLVVPAGPKVIRMVPPLVIKASEIEELLKRVKATFRNIE